jgi:hypothetical protein
MAVTYSWRIDTNKYAYIVPPLTLTTSTSSEVDTTDWSKYGFLSNTPLTDYFAKNVAKKAEETFGKNATNGKTEYLKAFDAMYRKIQAASENDYKQKLSGGTQETFDWRGMGSVDLLSADMYYDVDAAQCADLRGVGIKGVRYLGSQVASKTFVDTVGADASGVDLDNLSYVPAGTETSVYYKGANNLEELKTITVRPGVPGFVDVYGIFMNDQTNSDGDIENTTTPESIFVIRNAKDGVPGAQGTAGSQGETGSVPDSVTEQLSALDAKITSLETSVTTLLTSYNTILTGGWDGVLSAVTDIRGEISTINEQIREISGNTGTNTGGGTTPSTGSGSIRINKIPDGKGSDATQNQIQGEESLDLVLQNDTVYLLGYLMTNDEKGVSSVDAYQLFALPYLRVNKGQISFDGNLYVGGNIQGENIKGNIIASNEISTQIAISQNGFYQETGSTVENLTNNTGFTSK